MFRSRGRTGMTTNRENTLSFFHGHNMLNFKIGAVQNVSVVFEPECRIELHMNGSARRVQSPGTSINIAPRSTRDIPTVTASAGGGPDYKVAS